MMEDSLKDARDAVQVILDLVGPASAKPDGFWNDPFVLGFIYFCTHAYALRAGASEKDFDNLPAVYLGLLEGDAVDVFTRTIALQHEEEPSFTKGLQAADKFIAATSGSSRYDDDPVIIEARRRSDDTMEFVTDEHELTADQAEFVWLFDGLFTSELRRRFPEMTGAPFLS